jgi:TalC/MipB family fructose-6-phosphate aldolase
MELYLDSVQFDEIRPATQMGLLTGITTTPTFMHRHGITDIDGAIVEISKLVNVLHVEALGSTVDEIIAEAQRLHALPVECELVYKIPISNVGLAACKVLTDSSFQVNLHLVYTLAQAYLAMEAGATYVCPLVGRLHDQGHDAMALIEQCVDVVDRYEYSTRVMVSSVRHADHVRQALLMGAHACTMPWPVMKNLTSNALTDLGTSQFVAHTQLMTLRVRDVIGEHNPTCKPSDSISDALIRMTQSGAGAVSLVDDQGTLVGIFTDGDLRRLLQKQGKSALDTDLSAFAGKRPLSIEGDALLYQAVELIKQNGVDNLVVVENDKPIGLFDVQDLIQKGLLSI